MQTLFTLGDVLDVIDVYEQRHVRLVNNHYELFSPTSTVLLDLSDRVLRAVDDLVVKIFSWHSKHDPPSPSPL